MSSNLLLRDTSWRRIAPVLESSAKPFLPPQRACVSWWILNGSSQQQPPLRRWDEKCIQQKGKSTDLRINWPRNTKGGENFKKRVDHSINDMKALKKVTGNSAAFSRYEFYDPSSYTNQTHKQLIFNFFVVLSQ